MSSKTKKEVWKRLATQYIRYTDITLYDLNAWILEHVPAGAQSKDIRLNFEVDYSTGYYDEIQLDAEMHLEVLEKDND